MNRKMILFATSLFVSLTLVSYSGFCQIAPSGLNFNDDNSVWSREGSRWSSSNSSGGVSAPSGINLSDDNAVGGAPIAPATLLLLGMAGSFAGIKLY